MIEKVRSCRMSRYPLLFTYFAPANSRTLHIPCKRPYVLVDMSHIKVAGLCVISLRYLPTVGEEGDEASDRIFFGSGFRV